MFRSIQQALAAYTRRPLFFMNASFLYAFFQLLVSLALIGVLFIALFLAGVIEMPALSYPMLVLYFILLLVFVYFSAAFHGSLIYSYWNCFQGNPTGFLGFYRYALDNGFRFFWIFLVKLLVEAIPLGILAALYLLVLQNFVFPYTSLLLGLLVAATLFIVNFLFFGAFIASALYDMPAGTSIKAHLGFLRRRHVFALLFFVLYGFVFLTNFIPLVQLVSLFFTYPVLLTALTVFFGSDKDRAREGKGRPPSAPVGTAPAAGKKPKSGKTGSKAERSDTGGEGQ